MKNNNKKLIKGLIFICSFFLVTVVQAQEILISGKITDAESSNSLPGVNVIEKGTNNGTVSDVDGNYKISVSSGSTLVYSFVGYATEEINVSGRSVIDVTLSTDITQLSEVVVVGYGEQEKGDVTGAIADVKPEDFNKGAIVTPLDLIAGKIAGVQVSSNSGEPGGGPTIRVRGTSSINASQAPLYVIDGVPVDNFGFAGGRSPLNFLNSSDIESFTVLKDASAAAIYGSRGTNGVILITTKKGAKGEPQVKYNGWVSFSNAVEKVDMLNGDEFRDIIAEQAPERSELILNANTDWQAQVLRQGVGQSHELSISSGTDNMGYRLSLGFLEQEGIIKKSKTQRSTIGLNINGKALDDHLSFVLGFKGAKTNDDFQDGGVIGGAIAYAPSQPVYDVNNTAMGGYWEWPLTFGQAIATNPVSLLEQTVDHGEGFRGLTNLKVDYDVHGIDGLKATIVLGYDLLKAEQLRFNPSTLRSQQSDLGTIFKQTTTRTNELFDGYLNYSRDLSGINSNFDLTIGYEYQNRVSEYPTITGRRLSTDGFGLQSLAVAEELQTTEGVAPQRIRSYFARLNYEFNNKYLLTATVRNDGSSQFGPENQRGWFPSIGLGWRISEEAFLQGAETLSNLKLRLGYGLLGNQDFASFVYTSLYTPGDNFSRYVIGGIPISTIRPSARNEEIKWEETAQFNIGLDFELFEGRLSGSLDYYNKQTNDLINTVPVPAGTNLSNFVTTNIGDLENKGFEFTLNAVAVDNGDLRWDVTYNFSTNKNKLLALDGSTNQILTGGISGGVGSTIQIYRVGEPINSFYAMSHIIGPDGKPLVDGVDHNEDGETNDADIYLDNNMDGEVNLDDRVISGNPAPDFLMGLSSYVTFKGLDLSFTLRASVGNDVYHNVASVNGNYSKVITDIVPGNMHRSVYENQFEKPLFLSDVYIEDGSFLRMDNISLGYTLPKVVSGVSLRIYGTVQNAFLITGYEGLDPEIGVSGIDNNLYPRSRTFLLGLTLGL